MLKFKRTAKLVPIPPTQVPANPDIKNEPAAKAYFEHQKINLALKKQQNLVVEIPKRECVTPPVEIQNITPWKIKSPI